MEDKTKKVPKVCTKCRRVIGYDVMPLVTFDDQNVNKIEVDAKDCPICGE